MKLLTLEAHNFGSYPKLEYNYDNLGLSLIYGPTGSGKSTFQDAPVWILFGVTAKDGNADEVRSWTNLEEETKGVLHIAIRNKHLIITRVRGKSTQNDLFWEEDGVVHRGKDITETQKLLDARLGFNSYIYTASAYYNEFSPTGTFFTAKASDRRELFESLANLELPTKLTERIPSVKKDLKKTISTTSTEHSKAIGRLEQLENSKIRTERDAESWSKNQDRVVKELQARSENFEQEKQSKIKALQLKAERFEVLRSSNVEKYQQSYDRKIKKLLNEKKCTSCGFLKTTDEDEVLALNEECTDQISKELECKNPYFLEQENIKKQENHYEGRIIEEASKSNPFLSQKDTTICEIITLESEKKTLKDQIDALEKRNNALTQLHKICSVLRGELLKHVIKRIEDSTNRYLETYFDAELRAQFIMDDSDSLEVLLFKNGYNCVYRQLSKGQRSMLKLCFSVSVMKLASNKAGMHFDTLCFDEALDGLDNELKIKAYNLFCELEKDHETILVIDHSENLQNLFNRKYYVTMESDISTIIEE